MDDMPELLKRAQALAEARNHRLLPFMRRGRGKESRCVTCARQVYVLSDPSPIGAAIGGDAISDTCIRKPPVAVKIPSPSPKPRLKG
jgi:hypothetical protein